ncbi:MAG: type III-B CRISPR module RAMP protein Cmr1 [Gammaproteobacteria bacterium]
MTRPIKVTCPDVPKDIASHHPGTIPKKYAIEVITPLFGGGVEAGKNDPITLIRPSSIRGHLRFWWRATRGARFETVEALRQREGEIWGTAKSASPVTINVEPVRRREERKPNNHYGFGEYGPEAYVLFAAKQDGNVLCKEGFSFSLELRWLNHARLQELCRKENGERLKAQQSPLPDIEDIGPDIEAAVWAWVNFGGIGARTRRGCGALYCTKVEPCLSDLHPPSLEGFAAWLRAKTNTYKFPLLASHDHRLWPTFPHTICFRDGNSALACWKDAVRVLKDFRQGTNVGRDPGTGPRPGQSRWPEAESVRRLVASQRSITARPASWHTDPRIPSGQFFPRTEFGIPIIFEIRCEGVPYSKPTDTKPPNLKTTLQPGPEGTRMASPVILRPIRFSDGKTAAMIAVLNIELLV